MTISHWECRHFDAPYDTAQLIAHTGLGKLILL